MSEVDDRIVSIQFDNASFERKLSQTIQSLDKLSESLRFAGAKKGFDSISSAANNFDLSGMANSVDNIAHRFTALGIAGAATIAHLTLGALDFVKKIGGDILSPIIGGGKQRAINLEQAKFLFEGIGIDVTKGMQSALDAVKGTAFGLDEAAKIAAQFGAAGIDAGNQMTSALRGVAGVAALTGRSFSEIGDIFASSAATGVVNNQDLLQFATRGLNAAKALSDQLGITQEQVHEMAAAGQLDFKTFAAAMDKAFGAHATEANKTYTGSLANLHAAMSRLGASFESTHLEQQRDLFNAITPDIDKFASAIKPLITDFLVLKRIGVDKAIGFLNNLDFHPLKTGVVNLSHGFINLYKALKPIGLAFKSTFQEIFSGNAGASFVKITRSFREFTAGIKIGADTIDRIKSVFRGFFAFVEIGFTVFKEIIKTIGAVIHALIPAGDGLLSFGASTGDFLTNLNKALVAGGGIEKFFDGLREIITHPIEALDKLRNAIVDFFKGVDLASSGPLKALQDLRDKIFGFFNVKFGDAAEKGLGRLGQRIDQVHGIWDTFQNAISKVHDFLKPVLDYMVDWFKSLGHKLAAAFHPGDFNALLDVINVGLLGGLVVLFRNFLKNGLPLDLTGGVLSQLKDVFGQLTSTLQAMQTKLKADALQKIAIAIGILVASLVVLSLIDSKALTKALIALGVSFGQLIGALTLLDRVNISASVAKLNGIAVAMILIAGATLVLSAAIKILSTIKLGDLAKGLAGVSVSLAALVAATRLITADTGGLITAGIAMGVMAAALLLLSGVVKIFSKMSVAELAKGLSAVGVAMATMVASLRLITADTKGLVTAGVAMGIIATSLLILSHVVKVFAAMSLKDLAVGFGAVAVALGIMVGSLRLITVNTVGLVSAGIAMIAIATAMRILVKVIKVLGNLDLNVLAKGIGAFAATLLVLVVAVNAMDGALPGAAALIVVAGAMRILAKVLVELGKLSITQLLTGLAAIAGTLLVLAAAAALLAPVIPEMLALGVALAVLGGAFALFGAGAILVARAFQIMAESGAAGAKAIVKAISILVTAVPTIEKAIFQAVIGFAKDILKAAPLLIRLIQALLEQILDTMIELAPKFTKTIGILIDNLVFLIHEKSPEFINAGFELFLNFLKGIRDNIGEIANTVADIIVNFLNALSDRVDDVADAVRHFILTVFVVAIERLSGLDVIFGKVGRDVMAGIVRGLGKAAKAVFDFFVELPGKMLRIIKKALGINSPSTKFMEIGVQIMAGLLKGLVDKAVDVAKWFIELPGKILKWVGDLSRKLVSKGVQLITGFFNGIIDKIKGVADWFRGIGAKILSWIPNPLTLLENVGHDLIKGLWNGILKAKDWLVDRLKEMTSWIPDWAKRFLGIKSPSKVMEKIGKQIVDGLTLGLVSWSPSREMIKVAKTVPEGIIVGMSSMNPEIKRASFNLSKTVLNAFGELNTDINPTITPVLDLSQVEKSSKDISKFVDVSAIVPSLSIDSANIISNAALKTQTDTTPTEPAVTTLNFEQNNYSPTALSTNDIYRNTKSQFALAKEKLGVS